MNEIEQAMTRLAANDCHCASCAKTDCYVREKLQRLPVAAGGLNECVTYSGGYVLSDKAEAVAELYYRYRGMVQEPEQESEKRKNRYDAYRLAHALISAVDDDNPNGESNLRKLAGLLAYDYRPDQLRKDIIALKEAAGDAL